MYWEDIEEIDFYWENIGQTLVNHWQIIDVGRRLREYWENVCDQFLSGRPVQLVANMQKCNFPIFKCLLRFPEAPNPKTEAIFMISIKFWISRCENLKIDIFRKV